MTAISGSSSSHSSGGSHETHESDESHESSESHESEEAHETPGTSAPEETHEEDDDGFDPTDDAGKKEAQDKLLGASPPAAQGNGFTGSNYMDLGLTRNDQGELLDPRDPAQQQAIRDDIHADLVNLQNDHIDTVRVFVQPPGGFPEAEGAAYYEKVTKRMELIADEARKMDPPMRVTIDLLNDGNGHGGMAEYLNDAHTGELDRLTEKVVPNLGGYDNVDWSLGNELKAPNEPQAFTDWYVTKARALREQMGPGQRIIAELTPGALGHPDYVTEPRPGSVSPPYFETSKDTGAYQAMLRIANASDVVSIHYYPPTAEKDLPLMMGGGLQPQSDWASVRAWQQAAAEAPSPARFEIGEFSVPRDSYLPSQVQQGLAKTTDEYKAIADGWVQELHGIGVQKISFWQYQKNEDGHGTDPTSWDTVDNMKDGKEYLHVGAADMQPLVNQWSYLVPIRP